MSITGKRKLEWDAAPTGRRVSDPMYRAVCFPPSGEDPCVSWGSKSGASDASWQRRVYCKGPDLCLSVKYVDLWWYAVILPFHLGNGERFPFFTFLCYLVI